MEENKNIEETVEVKDRESQQAGSAEGKAGAEAKDGQENRKRKSRKEEKKEDETLRKQIEELSDKLAKEKDDYIRLMAEFETFRRRSSEEKLNMVASAAADTIKGLLPVLDDCERAMEILEKSSDDAAREGTSLIYTKLMDYLKTKGLARIEARGEVFDTDFHEAVTQFPAPSEDMKGKVIDVVQTGYTLNGKVLRYAKVVVGA
ncbi:MAG TPA: nucleotide exchange factor GrpE [Candidatus Cryptobacteroides pullicola]|nr:MAG: nucleotide exchange factor GrpE [Bacteroides sp. CAG:1060_57_27]HIR82282.1 nucleotide exchange factor GrpE [Candidatus Cryptobacteroides pullicola]